MTPEMSWYMQELKRKTQSLESDRELVQRRLERAQDQRTKIQLKRELEDIDHRLSKVRRGLLF